MYRRHMPNSFCVTLKIFRRLVIRTKIKTFQSTRTLRRTIITPKTITWFWTADSQVLLELRCIKLKEMNRNLVVLFELVVFFSLHYRGRAKSIVLFANKRRKLNQKMCKMRGLGHNQKLAKDTLVSNIWKYKHICRDEAQKAVIVC